MKWSIPKISLLVVMFAILVGVAIGVTLILVNSSNAVEFPADFKFGAATASYQIEGGWDEDGKSPNIWDTLTQNSPGYVLDNSTGNVAADSYHMIDKDIAALENIGFEVYRFSISWSRIIPTGAKINMAGIKYYSDLIDKLLAKNIEPLVTIYHWDLPQYIQDLGGWTNPLIVDYFKQYADVLFEHYGNRVKRWITVNEPSVFCGEGYGYTTKAPAIASPGVGDYLCMHHVLLSNAAAYHLYKEKYFETQKGQVGICLNSGFSYPDEGVDQSYADKAIEFELGKFSNAIFSKEGGYPQVMIDEIARKSTAEGRPWSRLPTFTTEQKMSVQGSADFLALNYYSSRLASPREEDPNTPISWWADTNLDGNVDPSWERGKSEWLYSVPEGLRDLLKWIKIRYENPIVMITENGWSDEGEIEDEGRVRYLKAHLSALANAINIDKCNVVAYTVWSLLDNFEWKQGYTERFGIHYIDFDSADKQRVPKASANFFKEFMKSKSFEYEESKKSLNPRFQQF